MHHTARKAEFQQLIQSVVFTADDSHFFTKKLLFLLMQLVRTWFYYEYCRVYLAYSGVGTRDLEE